MKKGFLTSCLQIADCLIDLKSNELHSSHFKNLIKLILVADRLLESDDHTREQESGFAEPSAAHDACRPRRCVTR